MEHTTTCNSGFSSKHRNLPVATDWAGGKSRNLRDSNCAAGSSKGHVPLRFAGIPAGGRTNSDSSEHQQQPWNIVLIHMAVALTGVGISLLARIMGHDPSSRLASSSGIKQTCLPSGHQGEAQSIQHQDVTIDVLIVKNEC